MEPPRKKQKRGGIKQRIARAKEAEWAVHNFEGSSTLAALLLSLFAWGFFSPQRVQEIAARAVQDIENAANNPSVIEELKILQSLGTKGKYSNKMHGQLMERIEWVSRLPKGYKFQIPLRGFRQTCSQMMLLPHELFSVIYHSYKAVWSKTVAPSVDTVKKFWHAVRLHPQMQDHPMKAKPSWNERTVPIAVHGDGVPIVGVGKAWSRMMTHYSWYSLIGQGKTSSTLMWIWAFYDRLKVGDVTHGTLHEFYKILHWSFLCLAEGKWPSHDPYGKAQLDFHKPS